MAGTVIIGAGQAGAQLAISLREHGYNAPITLIGNEPWLPYHRPPLSKDYLRGYLPEAELFFRGAEVYFREHIDARLSTEVTHVDFPHQRVHLSDGTDLSYDTLVFATGTRANRLDGLSLPPINAYNVRTFHDAQSLRNALSEMRHVLVVGAGFIGLEFATVARARSIGVTVVGRSALIMRRSVSTPISKYFAAQHRTNGITLMLGSSATRFTQNTAGKITSATIDGEEVPVDAVVAGTGVVANTELAADAGLIVENGIIVDRYLQTAQANVFAIGDCSRFPDPRTEKLVRIESAPNASEQARYLAQQLTGKTTKPYAAVPWFWSNQAGQKLQIAGLADANDDQITLPHQEPNRFSVARIRDGKLVAVESVNQPAEHIAARKLLASETTIDITELTSPNFSLKQFARSTTATTN